MRAKIDVNIHDTHIGIWQDDAHDETFRSEVFGTLIRGMRGRGWHVHEDPEIRRRFHILNSSHRLAARGNMRASIEIAGRCIKVEFWAQTWPIDNRNGRRYDFRKLQRLDYLDRLRFCLEARRIVAWLETIAPVTVKQDTPNATAMERIEKRYAESWHRDKVLGRPTWSGDYNRQSQDGALLEHGQTVWFPDRKGRIVRGTAYYNINNMWWVVAGGELHNEGCHSLMTAPPADLRKKRNERGRRSKLERKLALAIERMDFQRAELIKNILFGGEPAFMIWARDHSAYYRSQYSGYTTDRIRAGKYTRAEAERECRRVPHELEMVCPDGTHVRFDKAAA
ncbi:MAG: hypothetical protein EOQ49_25080 [Mesorhizobium sp.]|nr:MAG: hypothetical protein EOQ49_25080 [Mesorhizobium sp.]